jgi:hypothetical protein
MIARIPNSIAAWRSQVANSAPPHNPDNGNNEDEEDEDEDEEGQDREPAVIREPDEEE